MPKWAREGEKGRWVERKVRVRLEVGVCRVGVFRLEGRCEWLEVGVFRVEEGGLSLPRHPVGGYCCECN